VPTVTSGGTLVPTSREGVEKRLCSAGEDWTFVTPRRSVVKGAGSAQLNGRHLRLIKGSRVAVLISSAAASSPHIGLVPGEVSAADIVTILADAC
jgi:hypothetical protein